MLVPLTASLYVPGTLDDADKVLVDIGTGYFVEVSFYFIDLTKISLILLLCSKLTPSAYYDLICL